MALSDLTVFSEYVYSAMSEVQAQQIELFNAASRGAITMGTAAVEGSYSDTAMWAKLSGLVRRRNAFGTGAVSAINLTHIVDTMVKIAAGTPPVEINPSQFAWIQRSPEEAGAVIGQQLAGDSMADMLNTSVTAGRVAIGGVAANVHAATGAVANLGEFVTGASKFGDRSSALVAWVVHSKVMHDIFAGTFTNTNRLFNYGTINVSQDGFGRVFIMTDAPGLRTADGVSVGIDAYHSLGLVPGAVVVQRNNDYMENVDTSNGDENILRTWQAEWTFNLGLKGFAWDKTNGGASPNASALATATNWDKYATADKDLLGVLVNTR